MLNSRERQIILLLQEHDFSGSQIAQKLKISRRTVVRDINHINVVLPHFDAGEIVVDSIYHLQIKSFSKLAGVLKQAVSDYQRIMLVLLTHPFLSLDEIASLTYLSKSTLKQEIHNLSEQYKDYFQIHIKKGVGVELTFTNLSPSDFLAAMIFEYPELKNQLIDSISNFRSQNELLDKAQNDFYRVVSQYVSRQQVRLQEIAVVACYPLLVCLGYCKANMQMIDIIKWFFKQKINVYKQVTDKHNDILKLIDEDLAKYSIHVEVSEVDEIIFQHILRIALFPSLISATEKKQFSHLEAQNPFAFDFGYELSQRILFLLPNSVPQPDYLSLYGLAALGHHNNPKVKLLMIADRQSIGATNQMIINQHIKGVTCSLVIDSNFVKKNFQKNSYDLVIVNSERPELIGNGFKISLAFTGILNDNQLKELETITKDYYFKNLIPELLVGNNVIFINNHTSDFFSVLISGLKKLIADKAISKNEGQMILEREREGNQLLINGVSIPHVTIPNTSDNYRILAIVPKEKPILNNENVYLLLIVLVGQMQIDKSSIFSYLFHLLKNKNYQSIIDLRNRKDVIKLLTDI
ncbi:HTH domain-containing protein [Oenococcus oeni]|uniref:HTH domain-containing protein n=1 Tax=Oenococcus oeni TaxID=1247 RepID=UPI0008F8A25D|nr:HTH domain-containing protein [Oenococcus oeni]